MKKKVTTSFIITPTLQKSLRGFAKKNKLSLGASIRLLISMGLYNTAGGKVSRGTGTAR